MPVYAWQTDPEAAARSIGSRNSDAGVRAAFAAECIKGLHYLLDLDASLIPQPIASDVLGHNWQVVDISHARWAMGTAITALDLCAAALGRLHAGITGNADDLSVPYAASTALVKAHAGASTWLAEVAADGDYRLVRRLRGDLTHQTRARHYTVGDSTARTDFKVPGTNTTVPVKDLLVRATDLATRHVEAFVGAEMRGDLV